MLTGLLIALFAIVGAATVVGGGMYALQRRAQGRLPGNDDPKLLSDGSSHDLVERGLADIRVGDIVQYEGQDFLVEGVVQYDEDGHRWRGARITDVSDERWLVIGMERGGANTLRLTRVDQELELSGYPPEQLVTNGATFALESRGTASAKLTGELGELPKPKATEASTVQRCRWWRYETAGPKALVVEQWGGIYRVLLGEKINPSDVELMPGS